MKLKDLMDTILLEKKGDTYDSGAVMIYFEFPEIKQLHSLIDKKDLYEKEEDRSYGLEDEPHCTLLYGLPPSVKVEEIEDKIKDITFSTCKIYNPSLFKNKDYDVLKFDVKGDGLNEANSKLKELPYKNDYPDYHPHLTIGYIKSGLGKKYVDLLNQQEEKDYWLAPQYIIYSHPTGNKTKINIRID